MQMSRTEHINIIQYNCKVYRVVIACSFSGAQVFSFFPLSLCLHCYSYVITSSLSQIETTELREGFAGVWEQSQEAWGAEAGTGRLCTLPWCASFRYAARHVWSFWRGKNCSDLLLITMIALQSFTVVTAATWVHFVLLFSRLVFIMQIQNSSFRKMHNWSNIRSSLGRDWSSLMRKCF